MADMIHGIDPPTRTSKITGDVSRTQGILCWRRTQGTLFVDVWGEAATVHLRAATVQLRVGMPLPAESQRAGHRGSANVGCFQVMCLMRAALRLFSARS